MNAIKVNTKCPNTRYVALDNNKVVIAEGTSAISVINQAKELNLKFSILYIPKAGIKCFY